MWERGLLICWRFFFFPLGEIELFLLLKSYLNNPMSNQDVSQNVSFKQSAFLSMKLILVVDVLLISEKKKRDCCLVFVLFRVFFLCTVSYTMAFFFLKTANWTLLYSIMMPAAVLCQDFLFIAQDLFLNYLSLATSCFTLYVLWKSV